MDYLCRYRINLKIIYDDILDYIIMLSDAVKYKPLQVGAQTVRTFTQRIQPTSGATAYPLDNSSMVTFQVPLNRNQVIFWNQSRMQSRGNYSIVSAANNITARVDHSVYSHYKRSQASIDGVGVIESINEVGKLMVLWKQLTCDASQEASMDAVLEGCGNSTTDFGTGVDLLPATNTSASTFVPKRSYSSLIPLGMAMNDLAFPAFAFAGKTLEINITLAHINECIYATSGSTITTPSTTANYMDNIELILQVVQYSDEAIQMMRMAAGPELFYSFKSFDGLAQLVATGSSAPTINSNKRCVFSLLGGFWMTTKTDSSTRLTGLRSAAGITEMFLDIGGESFPQQRLTSVASTTSATTGLVRNNNQFMAELVNVVNTFTNNYRPSSIDSDLFYPDSATIDACHFAFGIDLEAQPTNLAGAGTWTGRDMSGTSVSNLNVTLSTAASKQMYCWYLHARTLRVDQATGQVTLLY